MGRFVVSTPEEQQEMLESIGFQSFEELFADVPEAVRVKDGLKLPEGLSEMEAFDYLSSLAGKNQVFPHVFRGAGAYRHYIPAAVKRITGKEEFITSYTPYQAEISQGLLQSIFEYQTMMCELTGMDAANASVYDGATAAAEAAAMCIDRKRRNILVSATTNPEVIRVIQTYCFGSGNQLILVPEKDGETDPEALKNLLNAETACFYVQQPNFYGILEDYEALGELTHGCGAKFLMGFNPIAAAILKTPAGYGADIAVGEGQPLGLSLNFGGPYLGIMTATAAMMRKLPGRIVGQTVDAAGNRAFVLTLQAREQHIRREKASSNVCSNQALCALTAGVYLSVMGPDGLIQAAEQCTSKAHYLQEALAGAGLPLAFEKPYFHEFVTGTPAPAQIILERLEREGYLGGLPLGESKILWCVTERNTRKEMDELVSLVKEACGK